MLTVACTHTLWNALQMGTWYIFVGPLGRNCLKNNSWFNKNLPEPFPNLIPCVTSSLHPAGLQLPQASPEQTTSLVSKSPPNRLQIAPNLRKVDSSQGPLLSGNAQMNEHSDSHFDKRFKLERKLMSGSYGTVYAGVRISDSTKYAIKIVDRRWAFWTGGVLEGGSDVSSQMRVIGSRVGRRPSVNICFWSS